MLGAVPHACRAPLGCVLVASRQRAAAALLAAAPRTYTHILVTRPDLALLKPLPPLSSVDFDADLPQATIYFPHWRHCTQGNEDWLAFGRAAPMLHYLRRLDNYSRVSAMYPRGTPAPPGCDVGAGFTPSGCGLRNSEGYLKLFASALLRAKLRPHPEMAGCLVQGLDPRLSTFKG